MNKVTVIKASGETEVFENTIGHQIGNGAVQVLMDDGSQRVFNNFKQVDIDPTEEEKEQFRARLAKAEEDAQAQLDAAALVAANEPVETPKIKGLPDKVALDS